MITTTPMPTVAVPSDPQLATEPALTIASSRRIANAVVALFATSGAGLSATMQDTLGFILSVLFVVGGSAYGLWSAYEQAKATRSQVFAPATVAKLVKDAATASASTTASILQDVTTAIRTPATPEPTPAPATPEETPPAATDETAPAKVTVTPPLVASDGIVKRVTK